MRRIGYSRRALFDSVERPALKPLPAEPFEYAEWKRCPPGLDYHIEVDGHWYSVPFRLIREVLEARITDRTVEIFHRGARVAVHARNPIRHRHTTVPEHMPRAHRRYADWTLGRLRREAGRIGPASAALVELILEPSRTRSRASAPASASCGWYAATVGSVSKQPASAASTSGPAVTARSCRSFATTSIARIARNPCPTCGRSSTATFEAAITIPERRS